MIGNDGSLDYEHLQCKKYQVTQLFRTPVTWYMP